MNVEPGQVVLHDDLPVRVLRLGCSRVGTGASTGAIVARLPSATASPAREYWAAFADLAPACQHVDHDPFAGERYCDLPPERDGVCLKHWLVTHGWQPVGTAPVGQVVLGWFPPFGEVEVCRWQPGPNWYRVADPEMPMPRPPLAWRLLPALTPRVD